MTQIEKRVMAASDFPKWAKVTSLPDTDTTITHNLGKVPTLILAEPAYDSGVFGSVAVKHTSYTATTFVAKASASGVDMLYLVLE